jgi:ABC-type nitrate/sulfonate/bicarbonate transport system substrate-binding protein
MRTTARRRWGGGALVLAMVALVAACGDDDSADEADASTEETAADGALSGLCPETVVIQADWEPESEHGGIYELVGDGYEIDTEAKAVTGPLVAAGEDTGVDVEIRIGGAPISYQPVQSVLYQDPDILMGYVRVSETMASQEDTPVVSVMATMDKSPFAIYWDPETYPEATEIADLKADGVKVFMGGEANVWQDFLVAEGVLEESQIDRSEADKPASFVAAGGSMAEAGFASAEPYMYEFEVPEWGKPVELQLIHDTGYPEYFQALGVREATIEDEADCLEALVPILQQAHADYLAEPAETNALIIELVETYDTGWIYTQGMADWSIQQQAELGIVGNGEDSTIGEFDDARVQTLLDITGEVTDTDVSGYEPGDFVTNEFIDTSIGAGG